MTRSAPNHGPPGLFGSIQTSKTLSADARIVWETVMSVSFRFILESRLERRLLRRKKRYAFVTERNGGNGNTPSATCEGLIWSRRSPQYSRSFVFVASRYSRVNTQAGALSLVCVQAPPDSREAEGQDSVRKM